MLWKLINYRGIKVSEAAQCNKVEVSMFDYYTRRGVRSSSSLRVVAIQTTNIFIRGCYLKCPDFLSQDICYWPGLKSAISLQA